MRRLFLALVLASTAAAALLAVGLWAQAEAPGASVCATVEGAHAKVALSAPSPSSPFSCSFPTTTIGPYGCISNPFGGQTCVVPQITLPSLDPAAWLGYLGCVITGVVEEAFFVVFSSALFVITWIENGLTTLIVDILAVPEELTSSLASVLKMWGLLEPPIAVLFVGIVIVMLVVAIYLLITISKLLIDLL